MLQITFYISLAINLLMAGTGSLEYLIGMINSLQLVIHLPLMHIIMPGNVAMFFKIILPFVMFDFLDTDFVTSLFFEFDEEA